MTSAPDTPAGDLPSGALWPFLAGAFGIAWGLVGLLLLAPATVEALAGPVRPSNPLFILAVYAPALSALALVLWQDGAGGLRRFLSRLLIWRMGAGWWALLLLGLPAVYLAGAAAGGGLAGWRDGWPGLRSLLPAIGFMLVLGPVEEFGWRGLALPILQRRLTPLAAGLVLGTIWGVWHLPAFFLSGTAQSAWGFWPFLFGSIAVSVILTGMFNAAKGSILIAALFHFQLNNPLWPDAQPWDMMLFAVLAVALVLAGGLRGEPARRVLPREGNR